MIQKDTEGVLQHWVSAVLRIGVGIAVTIGGIGGLYYLVTHGSDPVSYREFHGTTNPDRHISHIVTGSLALNSSSIMQLGVLVLIATPIARVLISLLGFIKEKDKTYVWITLVVLITLLGSIIGGAIRG